MFTLRQQRLEEGKPLKEWQTKVRAKVLRHDTPLSVRRTAAGDSQLKQRNFLDLKVSDWCRLFLDTPAEFDLQRRLIIAVRQSGFERPDNLVR